LPFRDGPGGPRAFTRRFGRTTTATLGPIFEVAFGKKWTLEASKRQPREAKGSERAKRCFGTHEVFMLSLTLSEIGLLLPDNGPSYAASESAWHKADTAANAAANMLRRAAFFIAVWKGSSPSMPS
jgi:hypothetical protein